MGNLLIAGSLRPIFQLFFQEEIKQNFAKNKLVNPNEK